MVGIGRLHRAVAGSGANGLGRNAVSWSRCIGIAWCGGLAVLSACSRESVGRAPARPALHRGGAAITGDTVVGVTATLSDSVRAADDGRVAWSTLWTLCWVPVDHAVAYELETVTSEGTSPRIQRTTASCKVLQVAAGISRPSEKDSLRHAQLGLMLGQLAYRVRAVSADSARSEWSGPFTAGLEIPTPRGRPPARAAAATER
jgi:hypothetical protein